MTGWWRVLGAWLDARVVVPALVAVALLGLLAVHFAYSPEGCAARDEIRYLEHAARATVLLKLTHGDWEKPLEVLASCDGEYPPFLHFVTLLLGPVFGYGAAVGMWSMALWAALLAGSIALLVRDQAGRAAGAAAAVATLLVPAIHGSVFRYYYDLPMSALCWASVAAFFVTARRRPVWGGVLAGALAAAAAMTKWTALPFAFGMLGAAVLHRAWQARQQGPRHLGRVAIASAVTCLVCTALVVGALSISAQSLGFMLGTFGETPEQRGLPHLLDLIASLEPRDSDNGAAVQTALDFYRDNAITVVFSYPLAAVGVALGAVWLAMSRRLLLLLTTTYLGQMWLLAKFVPVLDERFMTTAAPAPAIAAALGWAALPTWLRWPAAVVGIALGLGVAADFHLRGFPWPVQWEAHSSEQRRGWVRSEEDAPFDLRVRRCMKDVVRECPLEGLWEGKRGIPWWVQADMEGSGVDQAQSRACITERLDVCLDASPDPHADLLVVDKVASSGFWWSFHCQLEEAQVPMEDWTWNHLCAQQTVPPECAGCSTIPALERFRDVVHDWGQRRRTRFTP